MICKACGSILKEGSITCDQCGAEVSSSAPREGIAGRRQGRAEKTAMERGGSWTVQNREPLMPDGVIASARRPRSEGAGRPDSRRGTPQAPTTGTRMEKDVRRGKSRGVHKMMVNWALVWTVVIALILLSIAGGYVFLKMTDQGQLILARMGKDANALALWTYGEELLDQGYIERSINLFKQAYEKEPDREDMYERLQLLADAYEAGGYIGEAEKTYVKMYSEVDDKNVSAYRSVIRIMEDQNRRLELSSFLKMAYEKTGDTSFRRQREELIPSTPTTDTEAGSLLLERDVTLISAEDYDIYYTMSEEGELPEDGTLFTEPIHLTEGVHVLRAVAVSNDLISDELSVKYTINLPVPSAPYPNLAPNTYERKQWVSLKYLVSDEEKAAKDPKRLDITMYYTIDGQTPSSNSPIYDGTPIELPGGRVILKAVSVNGYGKVSNVLERQFKINNVPFKKFFSEEDQFSDFTLLSTTRDAFVKKFGTPQQEEEIEDASVRGNCIQLTYSWGIAKFNMASGGYTLYYIDTANSSMTGPRKSRINMKEADVTALYKDVGQAHDQNGDRSLYWDDATRSVGKLFHLEDGKDRIDYSYPREDGGKVTLSYHLENGKVTRISMIYAL